MTIVLRQQSPNSCRTCRTDMTTHQTNGQAIRTLAHTMFTQEERKRIKRAIKSFSESGSITAFVFDLSQIIQTANQLEFLDHIHASLPAKLKDDFIALCNMNVLGCDWIHRDESVDGGLSHTPTMSVQENGTIDSRIHPLLPGQFTTGNAMQASLGVLADHVTQNILTTPKLGRFAKNVKGEAQAERFSKNALNIIELRRVNETGV